MKIEIGESLGYAYLRHVKQCWLVQANWKASEYWKPVKTDNELEAIFLDMKKKLERDGGVFKQTKNASQFLKQSEIDVLGVGQDGNARSLLRFVNELAQRKQGHPGIRELEEHAQALRNFIGTAD